MSLILLLVFQHNWRYLRTKTAMAVVVCRLPWKRDTKIDIVATRCEGYKHVSHWAYSRCECFVINIQSRKKSHKHHERY
jgi:hypothetical protein